ncbi:MAG: outer membrane protein assembly factor BamD [Bacteroidales bacterium]|nr:outer membrane protein assembly factor BamD [Bacteroidales bacterium]
MKNNVFAFVLLLVVTTSCGEFNKVLKSTDYDYKFEYAKKSFEQKKYYRSFTLLEELVPIFKGTEKAEESLYLLGQSYLGSKDYISAAQTFITYYNTYPKGIYTELARFYTAKSYYLDSPDPRLDQSQNVKAINEFQMFLEYFPQSEKAGEAQQLMFELQEKLAYKEYLSAKLYYNLGNLKMNSLLENNYLACVVVSQNALKDYPATKYKEDFFYLVLQSKYRQAIYSVEDKRTDRYREVVDEYYNYKNEFPEGKYMKEANEILAHAQKMIKN